MTRPIEIILARLPGYKREPGGFVARCPAHADKRPSLRIGEADGTGKAPAGSVLLKCRSGCPTATVLSRLGLTLKDLFVADGPHRLDCRCRICRPYQVKPGDEPLPDEPKADAIWGERAKRYKGQLKLKALMWLATKLGVTSASLTELGLGMITSAQLRELGNARHEAAYTFPERDSKGAVVGISLRWPSGDKGFCTGSHRGLTYPLDVLERPGLAVCVEGASDTAALLTLGYAGIGRPSNTGGLAILGRLLRGRDCLMLGENDEKEDGTWPGKAGAKGLAEKLSAHWKRPVYWALPPASTKDLRAWLNSTGGAGHNHGQTFLQVINFEVAGGDERKRRLESLRRQARKESK